MLAKNSYHSEIICSFNQDILTHQGIPLWHQEIITHGIPLRVNQVYLSKYLEKYIYTNKNHNIKEYLINDIDWQLTFKMTRKLYQQTSIEESVCNTLMIKLRSYELPVQSVLCLRKPHVYKGLWKCALCDYELETFTHLFRCRKQYDNWYRLKKEIIEFISTSYKNKYGDIDDILLNQLNNLQVWNLSEEGLGTLIKGFLPKSLIILLKEMKLDNLDSILFNIVSKCLKSFKFYIWEYRNKAQIKLERSKNIIGKDKKTKYKHTLLNLENNIESN
jgi:hypothetical protein